MARLRRRGPEPRTARWTQDLDIISLDLPSWVRFFGGPDEGRRAWAELAGQYPGNVGTWPPMFWSYTSGIPERLRGTGSVCDDYDNPVLKRARLEWLLGPGQEHLRPGEREVIRRSLELVQRELAKAGR